MSYHFSVQKATRSDVLVARSPCHQYRPGTIECYSVWKCQSWLAQWPKRYGCTSVALSGLIMVRIRWFDPHAGLSFPRRRALRRCFKAQFVNAGVLPIAVGVWNLQNGFCRAECYMSCVYVQCSCRLFCPPSRRPRRFGLMLGWIFLISWNSSNTPKPFEWLSRW